MEQGSPSVLLTLGPGHSFPGVQPFWTLGVLGHSLGPTYSMPGAPPILTTTGIPASAQCPLGAKSHLGETLL